MTHISKRSLLILLVTRNKRLTVMARVVSKTVQSK